MIELRAIDEIGRRRFSPTSTAPPVPDHPSEPANVRGRAVGRDAVVGLQRTAGNRAVQRLVVVQRSPGREEREALVARILKLLVDRLSASELFVDASKEPEGESAPRQLPSLATLASAQISKSLAKLLTKQKSEGRLQLEWQFLAVGLKPPIAPESAPAMIAEATEPGLAGEAPSAEQTVSGMDIEKSGPEAAPSGSGRPSFVEIGQSESGAPSLGYQPSTRPRIVYANNPASPIGHKTPAIKEFEKQETTRLRNEAANEGPPVKKRKGSKSSEPILSSKAQERLRAAVNAKMREDEDRRLREEFGDVSDELLPRNIKSPELLPELRVPGGTGTDVFHAETRLVHEGCVHVTVSGPPSITATEKGTESVIFGKQFNCVLCSLYRLNHGLPFSFHTDQVKSWYLPEALGIAEFFGEDIAALAGSEEFAREFGTNETLDAQGLIDIITNKNRRWPSLGRGQKELT